jgi:serine/threonine-protein kinase HipA
MVEGPRVVGVIETGGDCWPPAARSSSFSYGRTWLERPDSFAIDPINLPLIRGPQRAPDGWQVHGAFDDTCPDGWGKMVIDLKYPNDNFGTIEYIAATSEDRAGFMGYGTSPNCPPRQMDAYGRPVEPSTTMTVAQLSEAARLIDNDERLPKELEPFFHHGSSVGGARPKAAFSDDDGSSWIAKFGMRDDRYDNARVESACLDMAEASGIPTPERRLAIVGNDAVLMVRRFDRSIDASGIPQRSGFLSARTVLGESSLYRTEHSYADLAAAARRLGTPAAGDVFRRMLLNVFIGNTDDHLKNHAFIRNGDGRWGLSPVYDLVPYPSRRETVMRLGRGHAVDVDDAFASHRDMGLRQDEAEAIYREVLNVTCRWQDFMDERGVDSVDLTTIAPAFAAVSQSFRSGSIGSNPIEPSSDRLP